MTAPTIFNDPARPWEDHLYDLTPVEVGARCTWKRDDAFAPLHAYGINGAKVRFLIWLVLRARAAGYTSLVTGGSVVSPQLARSAVIGAHYQMPVKVVLGGTTYTSALRHPNVSISDQVGATFDFVKVGYNPAIQKRIGELAAADPAACRIPYGISVDGDEPDIEIHRFHDLGARQVENLPDRTRTLVVPFGSGNSAASILLGLYRRQLPDLERVALIGIGPNRMGWLTERLRRLETVEGPGLGKFADAIVSHINLHDIGYTTYAKRVPWTIDGVDGHPTYEGKVLRYLDETRPAWWRDDPDVTCVWIVGGERAPNG